jgi:hypothetical protein
MIVPSYPTRTPYDGGVVYDVGTMGRVFAVMWYRVPHSDHLENLLDELVRLHRARGEKLAYVAIIPQDIDVPEGMQRHALAKFGDRAAPFVDGAYLILEGDGFKHAVQRSIITTMYFLKGQSTKVTCYRSIVEASPEIAQRCGLRADRLYKHLDELRSRRRRNATVAPTRG